MLRQKIGKDINQKKIIQAIKKYDIVSFDIFDTLVKRDCTDGKNLFLMMENCLAEKYPQMRGFAENRIRAEREARKKTDREEVTYDEIYSEMKDIYTPYDIEMLQNSEIRYEMKLCHRSHHMEDVYHYCVQSNKKIILISDMYLPPNVINEILHKSGITEYSKLYLSSEVFMTKKTGHLFDFVIRDLGVSPKRIIHIGDNWKHDIIESRKHGIASVYARHYVNSNMFFNDRLILPNEKVQDYRALSSFIDNHICDKCTGETKLYRAGYESEGPLLVGFSKWLKKEFEKKKIERVFFLSRDGQIMRKAYEIMFGKTSNVTYMYASRRAYIVPTLWMCNTMEEMVSSMFFPRIGTIAAFIRKMGLESERYVDIVKKHGYNLEANYTYSELFSEPGFKKIYETIHESIIENSKKEYYILLEYLNQINFSGKVAIVDIGWHGNMQKALVKICKSAGISVEISGFYLGLNPNIHDLRKQIDAYGFLFHEGVNEQYFELQRTFTSIFEMMFTADHGSVKKFKNDGKKVIPMFEPFEYSKDNSSNEYDIVSEIQRGALDFAKDISSISEFQIKWEAETVFHNLVLLGNAPNYETACMFGDIKQLGDKITYIAKPNNLVCYVFNPLKIKNDLATNPWKLGFFRRLFKVNLPYYELYRLLRKIYLMFLR